MTRWRAIVGWVEPQAVLNGEAGLPIALAGEASMMGIATLHPSYVLVG